MKRFPVLPLLAGFLMLLQAIPALAVVSPPGSPDYEMGPDDVLQISVRPRVDLNTQVTVLSDGTINLPSIGAIKAAGLTVNRLSQELTRRYGLFDRDITQVTVTMLAYNSQKIFLLGEVTRPGHYSFPVIPGIWDVVREGGGPTPEAELSSVQVIRGEGDKRETINVDLGAAINSGDFSSLPKLRPGDSIRLLRRGAPVSAKDQVYVLGQVRAPGIYPSQTASDVMSAIMSAGGPTEAANLGSVMITRRTGESSRTLEVDLGHYIDGGGLNSNVPVRPGDAVTVSSRGGLLRGVLSLNTILPVFQAIISSIIAVESIRVARN